MNEVENLTEEALQRELDEKLDLRLWIREEVEDGGVALNDEEKRFFSRLSDRCLELIREDLTRVRQEEYGSASRRRLEAMMRHQLEAIEEDKATILAFTQEQANKEMDTLRRGLFTRDALYEIDHITEGT